MDAILVAVLFGFVWVFFPPPHNFSFLLTFSSHTQRALRHSEKQQLWQAMLTCQPALSNSFGRFSNVTLALSISFKSGASLLTAAWERESPGAKAGKSSVSGWQQQESLVVLVSQPNHPLRLLIPATYRQVQAGKIPSFDCEERACLCHHNNLCFSQNEISPGVIAKILGRNTSA